MDLVLLTGLDLSLSSEAGSLIAFLAFLGAGCGAVCLTGVACLTHELYSVLSPLRNRPSTMSAEFLGMGVAKERFQPARLPIGLSEAADPSGNLGETFDDPALRPAT